VALFTGAWKNTAFMLLPRSRKKNKGQQSSAPFERRLLLSILATGLPCATLAFTLLWINPYTLDHKLEGTVFFFLLWLGMGFAARNRVVNSVRVLSSVVSSLKEDDFSFRATRAVEGDALGDLAIEINNLARALESERLGTMEAESLLRKVLAEAEGVIFAFSLDGKLKLFNHAAATFLGKREESLVNQDANELGIGDLLDGPSSRTISRISGGIERRWIVHRTHFRQSGIRHHLIMLSEASEALRAEERLAWQRMVRVLSHEINNSLAPIKSVTRTMGRILSQTELPERVHKDFDLGLSVIGSRAEALNRFLQSYAQLSKLPPPTRRVVSLKNLVERVIGLEARVEIAVLTVTDLSINVDPDQLEQVIINLTKNAVEAFLAEPANGETLTNDGPAVCVNWASAGNDMELWIRDRGIGLLDASNLFVPFYTTKETGTGIGLVLCRQIIEAHGGRLQIQNRTDTTGCEVQIRIPNCIAQGTHAVKKRS
jgi:two-component system, NtrC family, nitrogen regulation sensor histidine kinase NtrY